VFFANHTQKFKYPPQLAKGGSIKLYAAFF